MSAIPDSSSFKAPARWAARLVKGGATLTAALLVACGGSGDMGGSNNGGSGAACTGSCGSSLITMQDAAGDFLSYTVDVVSLKLRKASGATVETLPATTRVDFAQLVDLSELISAGQIPAGDYVAATMTVDYSNASIMADDGTGGAVALTPRDTNGNTLTGPLDLTVQLDDRHHLVITAGRTARLAFDFNLAVSNAVDLGTASVTVTPLIQATVVPPADLRIRVRGILVATDTMANTYTVNVRPFHLWSGSAGELVVHTTDTTSFEIDGMAYTGAAGLAALAAEPANTYTVAKGTLQTSDLSFTATRVLAGSSVDGDTMDHVRGVVTARSADSLTVRGATVDWRAGGFEFMRGNVTVNVAAMTKVTEEGATGSFGIGDISVGQRLSAAGTVSVDSASGAATLDATAGRVRLEITSVWGLVAGAIGNPLTLNLQGIEGHDAAAFDFAGTGASPATDANAAAYAIDTGALDPGALTIGAPARLFGFPVPFGSATNVDFTAQTLASFTNVPNLLFVGWTHLGSTMAFPGLTAGSTALDLDLTGVGLVHFLQIGPERVNLMTLAAAPQIVPDTTALATLYAIGHAHSHSIDNYLAFGDFITALAGDMNGTTAALGIAASGQYDSTGNTFSANHLAVLLND
ncbi:MAG TPA: hypothetical protein VK130_10985 [Steroidobacteraceae bacterium]|nr:hypothetical protein [Steroidobacteraceae bacterium]